MIIIGTSVIGVSHLRSGLPCQDACNYKVTHKGTAMVAVADGVGSVSKSDIGAKFVVSEAISQLEQIEQTKDKIDMEDIQNVVALTREKLKQMADQMNEDFENFATTLILLVAYTTEDNQKEVLIAHVGDGAVVAESD
ncbi:MAG: protein phosphatase 2C domain-containing protein, partial [Candidatus Calescibacterium sp.]|nr:protein phosphatase 2C domain-containing protein [Candidatus Calescibacterium sp.]